MAGFKKNNHFLLAWVIYAIVICVLTWPTVAQINSQLIGGHVDQWTHLWTFHWVKDHLFDSLFFSDIIFYPVGVSLATHNIAWLNILLWLPLQAIFGGIAAYNLVLLLIFTLNGLGLYAFSYDLSGSKLAAFVGGLIFTIFPYTLSHHDHANMFFLAWLPLALLFLRRAMQTQLRRDIGLTILFIVLTGWARLHLLIIGGILLGLYALYLLTKNFSFQKVKMLGIVATVSGLLTFPAVAPILISQVTTDSPEDIFLDEQESQQADLLTYFVPSYYHPIYDPGPVGDWFNLYPDPENFVPRTPYLGYTTLFLAISGLLFDWRRRWFWGATAVLIILFALGPIFRFNNSFFPSVPMPYRLIEDIYFIRILRQPHRFNIILGIPIAILAAYGVQGWVNRWKTQQKIRWGTAVLCTLILIEYIPIPFPTTNYTTPAWFSQLAEEPDEFAILNVPFDLFGQTKRHMFDQLTHGKLLVNGKVARVPGEALAFVREHPFLQTIFDGGVPVDETAVTTQLRVLAEENIRYIVLHKDLLTENDLAAWQKWIVIQPTHEDADLLVYNTAPIVGEDVAITQAVTPNLGLIRMEMRGEAVMQGGWLEIDAIWGSTSRINADINVCISLTHLESTETTENCQPLSEQLPTSAWQPNEIVHATHRVQMDPFGLPGEYAINLHLSENGDAMTHQPVALQNVTVTALPRQFEPTMPQWETAVTWQEQITLTGYDLTIEDDALRLTNHWFSNGRITQSYKIFLHLMDASGNLVAQADYVPRDWTYPTNWWEAGEYVVGTVVLSLENVPSGTYQLFIGLYDPDTGQRLVAASEDGSPTDTVLLTQIAR